MAIPLSNLNGHLARLMSDIPTTFYWEGVAYTGARATADFTQQLEIGGMDQKVAYQIFAKADQFEGAPPAEGAIFVVESLNMRVVDVRKSPDNSQLLAFTMAYGRTN